ncbi:hypothetical protein ACNZ3Z_07630 [Enterobacter kobei]|uniref:hypothetical protein n=1 Tax=Enterobacter kobei TaxID=208224 RepID=UPI003B905648
MGGTIEISEVGMTVNMADGGKIVIGNWGDVPVNTAAARPSLTPEEELYGRGLCLLPDGWEDLSGDVHWQNHLSESLRHLWSSFSREQKMAIAYSISELSDELTNIAYEGSW